MFVFEVRSLEDFRTQIVEFLRNEADLLPIITNLTQMKKNDAVRAKVNSIATIIQYARLDFIEKGQQS